MNKTLFILENEPDNILVYELLLKDYHLEIRDDLNDAIKYIESEDFQNVDAAILDLNLGESLKIGGFNVAYKIIKKNRHLPIIICSAYADEKNVLINAKRINATVMRKPINERMINVIEEVIYNTKSLRISDVEQATKEFITGAAYLKYILEKDFTFNTHFLEKLDSIVQLETKIIDDFNAINNYKLKSGKGLTHPEYLEQVEKFKDDMIYYIETLIYVVESTMYSQLNIEKSEMEFIEEILSTGHFILKIFLLSPNYTLLPKGDLCVENCCSR